MSVNKTSAYPKVGDKVNRIEDPWLDPQTIRKIDRVGTDVIAYFEEGGFWRLFQLRRIL